MWSFQLLVLNQYNLKYEGIFTVNTEMDIVITIVSIRAVSCIVFTLFIEWVSILTINTCCHTCSIKYKGIICKNLNLFEVGIIRTTVSTELCHWISKGRERTRKCTFMSLVVSVSINTCLHTLVMIACTTLFKVSIWTILHTLL